MKRATTPRKRTRKPAAQGSNAGTEAGVELNVPRLEKMIKSLIDNLENGDLNGKVSVGDLLKLLQLYKELTTEQIREVEVRWIDGLPKGEEPGK